MAFCRLILPLLVLSVVSAADVPVFLWGLPKTSLKSNPLTTVTSADFEEILLKEIENDSFMVVFTEESLSVEDISRKNADGETTFPFLHSEVPSSLYLPSVDNALRVLKDFAGKSDSVDLTEEGLSRDIEDYNNKVLFVNLKDAKEGESRSDMLRRHDQLIAKIFDNLEKKYDNVIGVYTGRNPSWTITHSRVRRQASEAAVTSPDYIMNGLRLYAKEITVKTENSTSNITGFLKSTSVFNETVMSTTMDFGATTLILNFRSAGGYWFFDTVTLKQTTPTVNEELYPKSNVEAILGFSYRCQQFVTFTSVNETTEYTLTFEDIKVQPFFEMTNETMPFGDSLNCVGFFSAPIWSGLFVVFILLAITFYGIMMMMDIRTMDRFDDPKGKTITINAGE